MKKLFIGLLVIAAGAGAYYFLQKKKTASTGNIEKELLVGKWKMDSLYVATRDSAAASLAAIIPVKDSSLRNYHFDFQKGGTFLQALSDSVKADTAYYEWSNKNELLIKESLKDSVAEVYSVRKLEMDSLILQSK